MTTVDLFIGVDLVVGTHLALKRKWISTIDDLHPPSSSLDISQACKLVPLAPGVAAPKAKGKAKAKAKAKGNAINASIAEITSERKTTKNALHYTLKCKANPDTVNCIRRWCSATKAEGDEHSFYTSQVKTPPQVMQYFAEMAAGRWVQTLCIMLKGLEDNEQLKYCGYLVDLEVAENLALDAPIVQLQDAEAASHIALILGILRHRASSCLWHTVGYPGTLAQFMHSDATEAQKGL